MSPADCDFYVKSDILNGFVGWIEPVHPAKGSSSDKNASKLEKISILENVWQRVRLNNGRAHVVRLPCAIHQRELLPVRVNDVGFVVLQGDCYLRLYLLWFEQIVGVQKLDPFPSRRLPAYIASGCRAKICLFDNSVSDRSGPEDVFCNRSGLVGGSIVDHDDLQRSVRLSLHRSQRLGDPGFSVETRNDYTNEHFALDAAIAINLSAKASTGSTGILERRSAAARAPSS